MAYLIWAVILIAIIIGVPSLVRSVAAERGETPRRSAGLAVLEERYARGEIMREEYLEKKRDISAE